MPARKKSSPKSEPELPFNSPTRKIDPIVGERVRRQHKDIEYVVSKVYAGGERVDIQLPGTNLQHRWIAVAELVFMEAREQPTAPTVPKLQIDLDEMRERTDAVERSILDHLSGEVAVLKKYLASKGISENALDELDQFHKESEERWAATRQNIDRICQGSDR